jgi:hypothetical protein
VIPLRSLRRLALGAAVSGAAIGAVPALASAASTCAYVPSAKQMVIHDGSGDASLRLLRGDKLLLYADGNGVPSPCSDGNVPAATSNTDSIIIVGPIANSTDGYIIDEVGGRLGDGATLESDGNSEIEVDAIPESGPRETLEVRGTPQADTYKVGANGAVDMGGDGDTDFSIEGGASQVTLLGARGADLLSGGGFGAKGRSTSRVDLEGGPDADLLIGGNAGDRLNGGDGNDTILARDTSGDVISGGADLDSASIDLFDVFVDGVEQIGKGVFGSLRLAPHALGATPGKTASLSLSWTHPKTWRDVRRVMLRLYDTANKPVGMINVRPSGEGLTADGAVKLMGGSRVKHRGKTVTARLAFRLPRSQAGHSLRVAVEATDRHGQKQLVPDAGTIRVTK